MPAENAQLIRAIEDTFVEFLKEDDLLRTIDIEAASNRDVMVGQRHIFVACPEAPHVGGNLHRARVVCTLVFPLHQANESERIGFARALETKLRRPDHFIAEDRYLVVCGWHFSAPREVSADRQRGDVCEIIAGVRRTS